MTSSLTRVPSAARRRLAVTLALFAVLFLAVGAVAATGSGLAAALFSVVAFVAGVLVALIAWGLATSVRLERAEQHLDGVIEQTVAAAGGAATMCGCGHEHDPAELHITDAEPATTEACAHDGAGAVCAHDCETCVLTSSRPSR